MKVGLAISAETETAGSFSMRKKLNHLALFGLDCNGWEQLQCLTIKIRSNQPAIDTLRGWD